MRKLNLKNVCLCVADCYNYGGAVASIKKSMALCDFGSVKFLTDIPLKIDGVEVIQIEPIDSKESYSTFIIKELHKYIDKEYVLIQQHDSWVLDIEAWDDDFFNYDVIGASWLYVDGRNNSNGGFSLRTKRLMEVLATDENIKITHPEDEVIGRLYRHYLEEKYFIRYPDDELCDKFSFELRTPNQPTFGFHSYFHKKYQPTVVVKRSAAMGDCVQVEPLLRYYHDKGYTVVLDTLPQFHLLFLNHHYKIYRPQEIDQRVLKTAKYVNLEMSYESNPKQLHLKSYFEYAGVQEEEYRPYLKNPQLNLGFALNKDTRLFKNYCVLHVDNRIRTQGRNIEGVNWEAVVRHLQKLGYITIQVGRDDTALIPNATKINCTNENFLCYVVGGASLMVGIDSGCAAIAAGFDVPSVIAFGSVNPEYIHADLSNIEVVTNHSKEKPFCDNPHCWSSVIGCEGTKCYINEKEPACQKYTTEQFIDGIDKLLERCK